MAEAERFMTSLELVEVTKGRWLIEPSDDWRAKGVCVAPPWFKPGQLLVARGDRPKGFLPDPSLKSLARRGAAGIVCERARGLERLGVPLLQVQNVKRALLALGKHARSIFAGRVIGITGSAGKTTMVSMLAHSLESMGSVGATQGSANLPVGIAWNLVGMLQSSDYWVVEMAIGQMEANSDMVRPHVAIVANVGPAHLEFHKTVEAIARKKARIFSAMEPGGTAVLCRDMEHYEIFVEGARERCLGVVSYGCHPEADFVLRNYDRGAVTAAFSGTVLEFPMKAQGKHMALNALGVMAAVQLLEGDPRMLGQKIGDFCPVEGRGRVFEVVYHGKKVSVIDESYNANPISVESALSSFAQSPWLSESRVLVLGDMLELGEEAQYYHETLLPAVLKANPSRILLCGPLMQSLWRKAKRSLSGHETDVMWFGNVDDLALELGAWLRQGDVVLVKGSYATRVREIVALLREQSG